MARRRRTERLQLVMVDREQVHDMSNRGCWSMIRLHRELNHGEGCYTFVKAVQVITYKIPGCRTCFGSTEAFRQLVRTIA